MTTSSLFVRLGCWLALLAGLASACASDKSLVSHAFNNVAARDNAYFLAREKLRATETKLYTTGRVNDYNRALPLFPTLDSTTVRANKTDLNDIIKKASIPIQHRPGSDWTDDAYLLVAWSRFYKMEFDDAALTFKYVNTTSKDPNAKHEALIGLMRTFVATKEFDNAKSVSDLLDKETGLPRNARQLFLTRADYYLRTDDPKEAIRQLEKAVPLIEQKNERSRTRYLLAQLYQEQGEDKKAFVQLNEILKRNPPYELDFFAKLMLAQVSDLSTQNRARLNKYFAALLKDPKNKEYRDKIYYEMARLDYRQQHYPEALKYLQQSARATTTNKSQKSYTYLLAGRIYYENLQKYRLAAAYYDSTVQNLPKEAANYAAIRERSEILQEFAKQYTIIETQDSLQALARLEPAALEVRLNTIAENELEAKRKEAARLLALKKAKERQAEIAARPGSAPNSLAPGQKDILDPLAAAGQTGGAWYFDNPATLGTARADFVRKWGDRKLQDNWRTNSQPNNGPGSAGADGTLAGATEKLSAPEQARRDSLAKVQAADPDFEKRTLITQYRKGLPDTPDKLKASDTQVEAALYTLGGIYKEQLRERERGYATYEHQVERYPRGANAPDAYYLLYLYYKDQPNPAKTDAYAAALQREFPNSIYAKLIRDPQYREHEKALHNAVAARVDSAFSYYKDQKFSKARNILARTEAQYPGSDLADRISYLNTLLAIRTQPPPSARAAVEEFYKKYPDSPLVPQARALADTYKKYEANQITGALASTDKPGISMFRPGEVDNRLRIFYQEDETPFVAPPTEPTPTPVKEGDKGKTMPDKGEGKDAVDGKSTPPAPSSKQVAKGEGDKASGTMTAPPVGTPPTGATPPPPAPVSTTAYKAELTAPHAVVLIFPRTNPTLPDLPAQLTTYNARFFRADNLQTQPQPLNAGEGLIIISPLSSAKVAQSYATKLRGPQSPLARLRGAGYQTLVISLSNLALLQSTGDLAGYQSFYQQNYK